MMITIHDNEFRFSMRVVGVAIQGNRVFLQTYDDGNIYALPGGKGEVLESSRETLRREMKEELDVEVEVDRLAWVVESFYDSKMKKHHELGLYYLMRLPERLTMIPTGMPIIGAEHGEDILFEWQPLNVLESLPLYPVFFRKALIDIPPHIEHVVDYARRGSINNWD